MRLSQPASFSDLNLCPPSPLPPDNGVAEAPLPRGASTPLVEMPRQCDEPRAFKDVANSVTTRPTLGSCDKDRRMGRTSWGRKGRVAQRMSVNPERLIKAPRYLEKRELSYGFFPSSFPSSWNYPSVFPRAIRVEENSERERERNSRFHETDGKLSVRLRKSVLRDCKQDLSPSVLVSLEE